MRKWTGLVASMLVPALATGAAAQSTTSTPAGLVASPADDELDEVRVMGRKLWQMREDIVAAEDRFNVLYNRINPVNDFDIVCKGSGTYIRNRSCKARFFIEAESDEAQMFMQGRMGKPPVLVQMERHADYRKAATAALESSPELRRLASELVELKQRYEVERRERFKDRWIQW